MIDLYSWATGNGRRASIVLEESGLPYTVHPVNLMTKAQKGSWFSDLSPLQRIPVILDRSDPEPVVLFESGAILIYVAEKSGRLLPSSSAARATTLKWLFFATSDLSPLAMQVHRLVRREDRGAGNHLEMLREQLGRYYLVLDDALADRDFLSGEYSIADIAAYPWIYRHNLQGIDLSPFPRLSAWMTRVGARPAVRRGMNIPPRSDGL